MGQYSPSGFVAPKRESCHWAILSTYSLQCIRDAQLTGAEREKKPKNSTDAEMDGHHPLRYLAIQ